MIWVGAALIIAGLVAMVLQPLRQGQLSGDRLGWEEPADTLEPRRPSRGLGIRGNWPGLALFSVGAVLMIAGSLLGI